MKEIAKALIKFHSLVPNIAKDADNPFFRSKYAPLESILPTIKDPLEKAGLAFTQIPVGECELRTILIHAESGETIEGTYKMIPSKPDPQGHAAAYTYMRRISLISMLGLNTDKDDDGNEASRKPIKKAVRETPASYEQIVEYITRANDVKTVLEIGDKVIASKNLTDDQKTTLKTQVNTKLDSLDPTQ